jgi:gliding motility-associated-like protein
LFTVDLGDDQLIELGSEAFILAQPSELADSVFWVLPESFLCPGILNCVDTPLETTLYRIRVLNDKGCIAEDEMRVRVRKPRRVLIPNVFSPNDDGYNDYVSISVGNDVARVRRFGIYNRWGEQIFEKRDFLPSGDPRSDGWDGRFRGQLLTPDVFVGVAEVEFKDGSVEVFEGSVTLVR